MKLRDRPEIKKRAKDLGLGRARDPVKAIRGYCRQEVERIIKRFGHIRDLNHLLEVLSSSLGVKFEEVHTDHDLQAISERYISRGELIFGSLDRQLDKNTDAVLIRLGKAQEWERCYVAVIDCRGHKAWRAYFSKWHEIAHRLTDPPQLTFSFRRTPSKKRDPIEQIVNRVAGDYAFYPPVFLPALLDQLKDAGALTFQIIQNLRATVCMGASKEATIRGTVPQCPHPQLFVIADYGLKKAEERALNSGQIELFAGGRVQFEPKLRAIEVIRNDAAVELGLRIYRNMEVPGESVITQAYEDAFTYEVYSRVENLGWWKHSRGKLVDISIRVEALKSGSRVYALINQHQ